MKKSNRLVRVLAAAFLAVTMVSPVLASGMSGDEADSAVCAFAQGIVLKVPNSARATLVAVFGAITGCTLTVTPPSA
jgi:hypothetical protein